MERDRAREEEKDSKEMERKPAARRTEERERDMARKKRESERDEEERHRKRRRRSKASRELDQERSSRRSNRQSEDNMRCRDKTKKMTEEDLEAEKQKLDEEMERRRRRVHAWQDAQRKKEEDEQQKLAAGKTWTLEGDSDADEEEEEEEAADKNIDVDVEDLKPNAAHVPKEEIDPLDAFMYSMVLPEVEKLRSAEINRELGRKSVKDATGRMLQGEDSDYEPENEDVALEEDDDEFMQRVNKIKVDKLTIVDHSRIQYPQFRKDFYIEVKEVSRMTWEEVVVYRKQVELKIHGKDVPRPIKTWSQAGLTSRILDTIKKLNFEKPMPIQAQALPVLMSGRDCIGVAKTGSGKTLAFVLPMLRHIKDQPPVEPGDGPIGLIMAPTRELVKQIHSDIKKFSKPLGIKCVPVYGGADVSQQIRELRRGAEIVVCTPGRMTDVLCTSSGKISNLRRVTYLVMDEADRMFDMGFEPQITRIVKNTRPDRQTVLFSATFPWRVEALAREVLNKPVEIQVGGRSVVNKDITQLVEVRPESARFLRLLEILGEWYEKGKIIVFVRSRDKCDSLFWDLINHGYDCLSFHGKKEQTDRESTMSDFKSDVCSLMVATSIAARGLDVNELELVINFDAPNHYEDYVHRVGRTGRAGRKGCAITFISPEEECYAPDLVKALELSEQGVPADLKALADSFMGKVNQGIERVHGTGYGGSGFKFNEEEDEATKAAKKAQAREYGFESDSDEEEEEEVAVAEEEERVRKAAQVAALTGTVPVVPCANLPADVAARATALAAAANIQQSLAKIKAEITPEHYEAELEINDFPQNARWKVTHKDTLRPISEWTGAAVTTRGQYFPPGRVPGPGERKLYLFIEGPTEISVKRAKAEVKRVLEDCKVRGG